MSIARCIIWFRQDLRLRDNPALLYAITCGEVLPIYIDEPHQAWRLGEAARWWLHHSLAQLNQSLNGHLRFFQGDALEIIPQLVAQTATDTVLWNRCYEPWRIARDKKIKNKLKNQNIKVKSFSASLLWEPWTVLKKDQTPYKVFTPYYNKGCLSQASPRLPAAAPEYINYFQGIVEAARPLDALNLLPTVAWYKKLADHWQPGESGAANRLQTFLQTKINGYQQGRDIPQDEATSLLSPHLHFGELSPNQVWYSAINKTAHEESANLACFLREIAWREFSYYLLFHFPDLPEKNFQPKFDHFPWQVNHSHLRLWQKGKTGIPMVDAGMRELWQTAYMHNRIRMISASFLVKNLQIHWHEGAKWFWDCLSDADLANNSASWQWVAGSGADAAPYFRIFNPVTQGEKFDPDGVYIRQYCPELAHLPNQWIHKPWLANEKVLQQAGITLGKDYPLPIVDLKTSRERALTSFKRLRIC